jgi:hypothetical protein
MYLTCPTCHFTVSEAAARSPFQNCPRCLLRTKTNIMMVTTREPPRRAARERDAAQLERVAEAKSRLRRPARDVDWA